MILCICFVLNGTLLHHEYPLTLSELYTSQFEESDRMLVEYFASYLFCEGEEKISEDEFRSVIKSFLDKRL